MPLHRSRSAITRNRAAARHQCASQFGRPLPNGKQCDEYPFASTREGAAAGRFRVRPVAAEQNQLAGTRLGILYKDSWILDGDSFYVYIVG